MVTTSWNPNKKCNQVNSTNRVNGMTDSTHEFLEKEGASLYKFQPALLSQTAASSYTSYINSECLVTIPVIEMEGR